MWADFHFCSHQYGEFLGLKEIIEEFMHTDESSKRFRAQLTDIEGREMRI